MSEDINKQVGRPQETRESAYSPLVSYLRENGLPKLEKLDLVILLGKHADEKDADDIFAHLGDSEVFMPELVNWRPETERLYNEVARGTRTHEEGDMAAYRYNRYRNGILRNLAGSGKYVAFPDVQKGDKDAGLPDDVGIKWDSLPSDIIDRKWSRIAARNLLTARIGRLVQTIEARERYVAQNLGVTILRALKDDPARAERTTLKATLFVGAAHESVVDRVRTLHPEVQSISLYEDKGPTPSYIGDVVQASAEGKEITEAMSDGALTETLLSGAIRLYLEEGFGDYLEDESVLYPIAAAMDDAAREAFHEMFMRGNAKETGDFVRKLLEEQLAKTEKGE